MGWNDWRVGTRLMTGFAVVLLLLLGVALLAGYYLKRLDQDLSQVVETQRRSSLAREWAANTRLNASRVIAIGRAANSDELAAYFKPQIAQTTQRITELQKALEEAVADQASRDLLKDVAQRRVDYIEARKAWQQLLADGNVDAAEQHLADRLMPTVNAYVSAQEALGGLQDEQRTAMVDDGHQDVTHSLAMVAGLTALALVAGAIAARAITRSVSQPVKESVEIAEAIARGDLTHRFGRQRGDELGGLLRALQAMQASLVRVVGHIHEASDRIGTASREIASGNHDLSARTEQTAGSLEETASSMEQLTATVRQSAVSAREASDVAANASGVAVKGGEVVEQVVVTMHDIEMSSQRIGDIIGVIDGIAFQTNILALNAAVEAARAGEQGRGFAVVAGEVRALAGRSAEAAKEIKDLIQTSMEKVQGGTRLVRDAGSTMGDIVLGVQRVSEIMGQISTAAAEQSEGIAQVNGTVNQLDRMTQQNAALVEQSAAAAESLREQAEHLARAVSVFKLARS